MVTVSNSELGRRLGVSHATISRIRSGTRAPSYPLMKRIARLVDWDVTEQVEVRHQPDGQRRYSEAFEWHIERFADTENRAR